VKLGRELPDVLDSETWQLFVVNAKKMITLYQLMHLLNGPATSQHNVPLL